MGTLGQALPRLNDTASTNVRAALWPPLDRRRLVMAKNHSETSTAGVQGRSALLWTDFEANFDPIP
ncbi:hypothetical protein CEJ86_21520 [Sinorhizobium meliloti]|uniref:Uncharacterized protein n=1 Tax=Rhizobium meliloti TaxID=382 RepID=A0A2J0YYH6_RHIML|nr:hypothetical protein CEJ86_21520 [Sinorhizobium meliloti]